MVDVWSINKSSNQNNKIGPLIPSTHQIIDIKKQNIVKREICKLWGLKHTLANNPSPQPVSLDRANIPHIHLNNYAVAEKTDGVRYLLLLMTWPDKTPAAIMCSRKYDMYEIRVVAEEDYFKGTLFDGELVWQHQSKSYIPPRQLYLVFDMVALSGVSYVRENYMTRYQRICDVLDCAHEDVMNNPLQWRDTALTLASQHKIVCEGNQYCLKFQGKPIMAAREIETVWRCRDQLGHSNDGLIFIPIDESVKTGTQTNMYKWKTLHTIDLLWECTYNEATKMWDHVAYFLQDSHKCAGDVHGIALSPPAEIGSAQLEYKYDRIPLIIVPNEYTYSIIDWHTHRKKEYSFSHIVECMCTLPQSTDWIDDETIPMVMCQIIKIRYDKTDPNQHHTIERTLNNIYENITIKELIDSIKK